MFLIKVSGWTRRLLSLPLSAPDCRVREPRKRTSGHSDDMITVSEDVFPSSTVCCVTRFLFADCSTAVSSLRIETKRPVEHRVKTGVATNGGLEVVASYHNVRRRLKRPRERMGPKATPIIINYVDNASRAMVCRQRIPLPSQLWTSAASVNTLVTKRPKGQKIIFPTSEKSRCTLKLRG
jgi:hypothetical protein